VFEPDSGGARRNQKGTKMSVSAVGSAPVAPTTPERAEGPGPDHDGDSDDAGAITQALQAAPAPGTGLIVNKTA